ncbi:kallikrein-7-like [Saccopteryx leptura]|uniref:kallikrein-7-like n=1 Tax=Saccopteryx leptura TaxID=249018 RepID=UPI00339CD2B6
MAGPSLSPLLVVLLSLALASVGQGAQDTGERIINGIPCPRGSQPWQVALFQGREFECAGVLIHEQWVLTVAHCYLREYMVQMGSDLLFDENVQRIRATESFIHPRYNNVTDLHDIMLVKLSYPATLSSTVEIVLLPEVCQEIDTDCTVSGWGLTSMNATTNSSELMCSNVTRISIPECKKTYDSVVGRFMMCADSLDKLSCICTGDSGSPLMCNGYLEGLVSSGHFPCVPPFDPAVYTRVCRYRKWIVFVMCVHHEKCDNFLEMVSIAFCITNGMIPLAKAIHDNFGLVEDLMQTVLAITDT